MIVSNILMDMRGPYAMIKSEPESLAMFVISSAAKAIAKIQIYSVRWCRKVGSVWYFRQTRLKQTLHLKRVIVLETRLSTALEKLHQASIPVPTCAGQEDCQTEHLQHEGFMIRLSDDQLTEKTAPSSRFHVQLVLSGQPANKRRYSL